MHSGDNLQGKNIKEARISLQGALVCKASFQHIIKKNFGGVSSILLNKTQILAVKLRI
jgi:hypothetical protein